MSQWWLDKWQVRDKMKRKKELSSPKWCWTCNGEEKKVQLLSRFPSFRIVGSHRAKKQSCSTRQGLRVGTSFGEFRQLQEVGVFSYSVIFGFKSFVNDLECLRP